MERILLINFIKIIVHKKEIDICLKFHILTYMFKRHLTYEEINKYLSMYTICIYFIVYIYKYINVRMY